MSSDKRVILPDFIEAALVSMNQGVSEEKLEEIKAAYAEQMVLNEKHKPQTDNIDLTTKQTRPSNDVMASFGGTTLTGNGNVLNPTYVVGPPDDATAAFLASYVSSTPATAYVRGPLTGSGNASGSIYVAAFLGVTGSSLTGNYALVWGSDTGSTGPWTLLGQVQITSTTPTAKYVGYTSNTWVAVMVGTAAMGGSAMASDIRIDSVHFITS